MRYATVLGEDHHCATDWRSRPPSCAARSPLVS